MVDHRAAVPNPADPNPLPPRIGPRLLLDRTAVLVVGLVAGFAVGLSFDTPSAPVAPVAVDVPAAPGAPDAPGTTPAGPVSADVPPTSGAVDARVVERVRAANGVVRIGVFGDSFGVGVWDGLYRQLPREQGYEVLRFSKEATGFTRYNVLNVEERAREQLAKDPVDIAVISFGANDAIPFFADRAVQELMSPGWQRIVGERIDRFVATARSTGAQVYWIGLPAMRDPTRDANMQAMNAFYAARMRRLGVPFFDTRALSVGPDGKYAAHLPDAKGVPRLMRTPDGLHMIGIGYQRIAGPMIERIREQADAARTAAGTGPFGAATPAAEVRP